MILKPCDQYPSEPGVLKTSSSSSSRPLSAQSNGGVFMGNLKPKSYEESAESEIEDDTNKVGQIFAIFVICNIKTSF